MRRIIPCISLFLISFKIANAVISPAMLCELFTLREGAGGVRAINQIVFGLQGAGLLGHGRPSEVTLNGLTDMAMQTMALNSTMRPDDFVNEVKAVSLAMFLAQPQLILESFLKGNPPNELQSTSPQEADDGEAVSFFNRVTQEEKDALDRITSKFDISASQAVPRIVEWANSTLTHEKEKQIESLPNSLTQILKKRFAERSEARAQKKIAKKLEKTFPEEAPEKDPPESSALPALFMKVPKSTLRGVFAVRSAFLCDQASAVTELVKVVDAVVSGQLVLATPQSVQDAEDDELLRKIEDLLKEPR